MRRRPQDSERVVRRLGPKRLRARVSFDRDVARTRTPALLMGLLGLAAEEHVAWVLRELGVNCVLDVGANRGQYARRLRRAGYAGRIVSFEPVSHFAEDLEKAAAEDSDWQVHRCAAGQEDTRTTISVAGGRGRMSSLLHPSEFGKEWSGNINAVSHEEIAVRRLDGLFDEVTSGIEEPRVYLKLDTQGFDLEAFAGVGARQQDLVAMQSELSCVPIYDGMPRLPQQIAVYEEAGFELSGMFPVSLDKPTMRVIEFDAVLVRSSTRGASRTASAR